MSVNSSSSSSLPSNSSSTNINDFLLSCYNSSGSSFSLIAFTATSILLILPLCIFVIYLGFQRWRKQTSHSDIFTFHVVVIELMNVVGAIIFFYGVVTRLPKTMAQGLFLFVIYLFAQVLFHTLTCVERYLAAVHPVIYLGLRKEKGIRIRNISIVCAWLLAFANMTVLYIEDHQLKHIFYYGTLLFVFLVISFCSLSVLHVLVRPGPGAGGEGGQRVDRSKMRAFYTIMAILGVLLLRVVGSVVFPAVYLSEHQGESEKCGAWFVLTWLTLPSSLVLPLLFLHRAGQLLCCRNSNTSGRGSD